MSFFKESYTSFKITYIMNVDKYLGSSSKQVEIAELCSESALHTHFFFFLHTQFIGKFNMFPEKRTKQNKQTKIPLFHSTNRHPKYWTPIPYDTIEDRQNKKIHLLFFKY